ncbi:MAG: YncE family protein [Terracidiphilus sp.]|jgi:DNA-binding beta-propeller fold protein YncE
MKNLLAFCLSACAALSAQQTPAPTELASSPFVIKNTWIIGGSGNWDYLTLDPQARQLFIAHGAAVQVIDIGTGTVAGQVTGFRDAHSIALDDTGEFGYVSDGPASQVKVFDRRSFKVVATIPTGPSPRAVVFEPQTRLVFAVSAAPLLQRPGASPSAANQSVKSSITVIDAQTHAVIGKILLPGKLGFAATGGAGQIYISLVDRNEIAWIDATAIDARLHGGPSKAETARAEAGQPVPARLPGAEVTLDWSAIPHSTQSSGDRVRFFALGPECRDLRSLAVDSSHMRLFAACNNQAMDVLNGATGELVASLPTGAGVDAIAYDPDRGLIYTANGAAMGSLTVIRQDVTDTYAVIQNLPTRQRARTLAVDPVSGDVYLVTDLLGMPLDKLGGVGSLQTPPVSGSFQVLVIAH